MSDERAVVVSDIIEDNGGEGAGEGFTGFTDIGGSAEIFDAARSLAKGDLKGASILMRKGAAAGLTDVEADLLIRTIAKAVGIGVTVTRKAWEKACAEEAARAYAAASAARAAHAAAEAAEAQCRREEERERLKVSCSAIALSATLLDDMTKIVQALGVVGEGASIRGGYLAFSSRLLKRRAICLLRRGAPAGGKNYLFETTFPIIPENAVVRVSSGSPLSLVYYGDGDEDALKHKVVYIPEAAVLVEKNGVESPLAIMLRGLISEGRIDRIVAVPQAGGPPVSQRIRRNGPIAAVLTSARANVEEELLTRLMSSDADEGERQTFLVLKRILREEEREVDPAEIEAWLDYQRWLEMDAPYDVVIPFRRPMWVACVKHWRAMRAKGEKLKLRIRRDAHGFLTAIRASAVLHKAQRGADEKGRIVATLDDYRHAHEAFDAGLASMHQVATPATLIAVVKAVEAMGATETFGVKVTVRALMDKLGVASFGTALERLRDAEARGFLKPDDQFISFGATNPRFYKIGKSSEEIEEEIGKKSLGNVFPKPEEVECESSVSSASLWNNGTRGTDARDASTDNDNSPDTGNCSPCSIVPEESGGHTRFAAPADGDDGVSGNPQGAKTRI
jgi:hypothetical protein